MSESLVAASSELVVPPNPPIIVIRDAGEIQVTASKPNDMAAANAGLIAWCMSKIQDLVAEKMDMSDAYEKAKKNKWSSSALQRQVLRIQKRVTFFEKMLQALQLGYYIVPNFPVTAFVVRTKAKRGKRVFSSYRIGPGDTELKPLPLPAGEGEYKNPFQNVWTKEQEVNGQRKPLYYTDGEFESIEFPLNMARPHIMDAVERAMALKIFDDIGVLPDPSPKKKDPIIVGRIFNQTHKYNREPLTFMLCWHLDTRAL